MPTKRRRRGHTSLDPALDEARRFHVETGDCLLAGPERGCACGLRLPDGEEDTAGIHAARERFGLENETCHRKDSE